MSNIIDEYFRLTKQFRSEYGKNTIVFIQEGNMYNVYADNIEEEQIKVCRDILRLSIIQKDGTITSTFRCNMYKYYEKSILSKGYTIVYVDQVVKLFPYKRIIWEVREIRDDSYAYSNDSRCSIGTCLYASCCPSLYAHNLRTFD